MARTDLPRLYDCAAQRGAAAWLAVLMVLAGFTEGIGIVLLVPLLGALEHNRDNRLSAVLGTFGLPLRLDVLLAMFVAIVALRAITVQARALAAMRLEYAVIDRLRQRAWQALLHCDWRTLMGMERARTASLLISRVDQAGLYVNQLLQAAASLVTLAGIGLAALAISSRLTLGAALAGLAVLLAFHGLRRRAAALGERLGEAYAGVYSRLGEGLGALRAIKGLAQQERAQAGLTAQFAGLRAAQFAYQRDLGRGQVLLQGGGAAVLALLVWLALARWQVPVAVVLPMVALFARALPLIGTLQQAALTAAHSRPAVDAALTLIAEAEAAREPDGTGVIAPVLQREIRLEAATVVFAGEPRPALDAVTATIPARGITAITGSSGAGKSTLADLAAGLLSPDAGRVLIDDVPLEGPLRQAWRGRVAYVQQDPVLLSASLRDNLRWAAPEADDAALMAALRAASAGFALDLPHGLDTMLGDGGRQLSGGERQRLMLARALLRDPALLILDEATSALDPENEARIAEALVGLKQRIAVIVIGHRGILTELADQRIPLEHGKQIDPA